MQFYRGPRAIEKVSWVVVKKVYLAESEAH